MSAILSGMRNNNQAVIRKISGKSLKNNRMRNIFAILAIILTGMLFTAVFSLCGGMIQVAQEQTMREVGGKFHAGLKRATEEQYERISADPSVKQSSYNIFLGYVENVMKRQAELRYIPDEKDLEDYFIILEEGRLSMEEDEVVVDTIVMDEFQLPHKVGEKIPLSFYFCGEFIEKEFTVSGWYEGDYVSHASELFLSEVFWQELRGERTDEDFLDWFETHPNDSGVGLRQINLFFSNTSKLEEKVCQVIENAGYVPGTELDYGVNWAYMQSRLESVDPLTYVFWGAAVLVILITGYLIIYNIFQISVVSDIRFYGLLERNENTKLRLEMVLDGEMPFSTHFYGYSTPLLKNLKVIEGTLDMEKFQSGDYILAGDIMGCGEFTSEERVYRPGDKIKVSRRTESSELHEVKDEHGETLDVWYDNPETKEYEVMAVVSIPYSMNSHMYPVNGMDLVLPLKEFEGNPFVKRLAWRLLCVFNNIIMFFEYRF